ncbi:MAG TPA: helix-turn-helix transcriptional regulator [Pirellulales bacterium]|nr:helix-turn-helix transcriptional regulator [Pirellulales bacterium]
MPNKQTSDLDQSVRRWKKKHPELAVSFDDQYEIFKIGVMLREAREAAGISQAELAAMVDTQRTAISRLENRAQDVKLSTIEKVARALGRRLKLQLN